MGVLLDFNNDPNFLPYVQRHELEALMFSSVAGFELVVDDINRLDKIKEIIQNYPNPEDINSSPQKAPSKRLEEIYNYDKKGDGELIFEIMDINDILFKCPRFSNWIEKLITKLNSDAV